MEWYKMDIRGFFAETESMTMAQVGAYMRLVMWTLLHEAPLPTMHACYRAARASRGSETKIVRELVTTLFEETEKGWAHGPALEAVRKYRGRLQAAREKRASAAAAAGSALVMAA